MLTENRNRDRKRFTGGTNTLYLLEKHPVAEARQVIVVTHKERLRATRRSERALTCRRVKKPH